MKPSKLLLPAAALMLSAALLCSCNDGDSSSGSSLNLAVLPERSGDNAFVGKKFTVTESDGTEKTLTFESESRLLIETVSQGSFIEENNTSTEICDYSFNETEGKLYYAVRSVIDENKTYSVQEYLNYLNDEIKAIKKELKTLSSIPGNSEDLEFYKVISTLQIESIESAKKALITIAETGTTADYSFSEDGSTLTITLDYSTLNNEALFFMAKFEDLTSISDAEEWCVISSDLGLSIAHKYMTPDSAEYNSIVESSDKIYFAYMNMMTSELTKINATYTVSPDRSSVTLNFIDGELAGKSVTVNTVPFELELTKVN